MIPAVLLTAVGLLASVCLFRAATLKSVQIAVAPSTIEIDGRQAAEHLAHAVQFRTVSYDPQDADDTPHTDPEEFRKFHDFLRETYPKVTETLDRHIINEWSLVYTWQGTDTSLDPILLMGHLDVVPVEYGTETNWTHAPFAGVIAPDTNGTSYIWGRGTLDVKNNVIAILEAVEYLLSNNVAPRRSVYIAMGHDEETGGHQGNARIAKWLREKDVRFFAVLDEGGYVVKNMLKAIRAPIAAVGIAEKGAASLTLRAQSQGGHASSPPRHTAIGTLSKAVQRLESHPFPAHFDFAVQTFLRHLAPEMPFGHRLLMGNTWLFKPLLSRLLHLTFPSLDAMQRTTIAPTMIEGGVKPNVLPHAAEAVLNIRTMPGCTTDDVHAHVTRAINNTNVTVTTRGEPHEAPVAVSDIDSTQFRILQETIGAVFTNSITAPIITIQRTDSMYYIDMADQVFRFSPGELDTAMGDLDRIHGVDERIGVETFEKSVKFMIEYITAMTAAT